MPLLSPAQATVLHNDIVAHSELQSLDDIQLRDYYNAPAPSNFYVWKTKTPVSDIKDTISWPNYTPANPTTALTGEAIQKMLIQQLACQGKQFNLQMLLTESGIDSNISTGKANIRAGLQDATSQVPSDVDFGIKSGGWVAIKAIIQRPATRLEKLFATGTGTTVNPATLVVEGNITYGEINLAR